MKHGALNVTAYLQYLELVEHTNLALQQAMHAYGHTGLYISMHINAGKIPIEIRHKQSLPTCTVGLVLNN